MSMFGKAITLSQEVVKQAFTAAKQQAEKNGKTPDQAQDCGITAAIAVCRQKGVRDKNWIRHALSMQNDKYSSVFNAIANKVDTAIRQQIFNDCFYKTYGASVQGIRGLGSVVSKFMDAIEKDTKEFTFKIKGKEITLTCQKFIEELITEPTVTAEEFGKIYRERLQTLIQLKTERDNTIDEVLQSISFV